MMWHCIKMSRLFSWSSQNLFYITAEKLVMVASIAFIKQLTHTFSHKLNFYHSQSTLAVHQNQPIVRLWIIFNHQWKEKYQTENGIKNYIKCAQLHVRPHQKQRTQSARDRTTHVPLNYHTSHSYVHLERHHMSMHIACTATKQKHVMRKSQLTADVKNAGMSGFEINVHVFRLNVIAITYKTCNAIQWQ